MCVINGMSIALRWNNAIRQELLIYTFYIHTLTNLFAYEKIFCLNGTYAWLSSVPK